MVVLFCISDVDEECEADLVFERSSLSRSSKSPDRISSKTPRSDRKISSGYFLFIECFFFVIFYLCFFFILLFLCTSFAQFFCTLYLFCCCTFMLYCIFVFDFWVNQTDQQARICIWKQLVEEEAQVMYFFLFILINTVI